MVLLLATIGSLGAAIFSDIFIEQYLIGRIALWGNLVGFERTENAGIAFGLSLPSWALILCIPVAFFFVGYLAMNDRVSHVSHVGYGLILGGGIANVIDRLVDGTVTDFVQIGWWPLFNIADSCITVGVVMILAIEILRRDKNKG